MTARRFLRGVAILIAVLGVIDPAITADRRIVPQVAVIAAPEPATGAGETTADRVTRTLAGRYRVVRGPSSEAAVTIVAGAGVPEAATRTVGPGLGVVPVRAGASIAMARVDAPARAKLLSRVAIGVTIDVAGPADARVALTLEHDGVVLDRVERDAGTTSGSTTPVPLRDTVTFVPTGTGMTPLRIRAAVVGTSIESVADVAIDVNESQWSVLFYDPRPSWQSTFVRRALERDPRFDVRSIIRTTTNVATASGGPAVAVRDPAAIAAFDAVIVGAPAALTAAEIASLDTFASMRGGAVVLLLDAAPIGALAAIVGATGWRELRTPESSAIEATGLAPGLAPLTGAEIIAPREQPDLDRDVLASMTDGGIAWPAIVESPLGAGRVIVSGAIDAWQHRGVPESSSFDAFWRLAIARAASASPAPLEVATDATALAPGGETRLRITQRDIALADPAAPPPTATISAESAGPAGRAPIRLWPDAAPGRWTGMFRAPRDPGVYTIAVTDGTSRADAHVVVEADVRAVAPDDRELLAAWAASRSGSVVTADTPGGITDAVDALVGETRARTRVWPMRSAWWIVPFALAICGEWWLRRRADLR